MDNNEKYKQGTQEISGTTYVFIDKPYWDKSKKQTRHKREYIGKLGEGGDFVPNKNYCINQKINEAEKERPIADRKYFGATHLLDCIGKTTGIEKDLKSCFGDEHKKIMSLVYFLVLEGESAMYRFPKWARIHNHPNKDNISSQQISDLLGDITEDSKMKFFKLRSQKCLETEYLAYDTTSISSYSELIGDVKYGHNKDLDSLPQINLALIFGEKSMLPVYYRKLPGNISDVTTVKKMLRDIEFLNLTKVKLVMDKGFYSSKNINELYKNSYKFIIAAKTNLKFVKSKIDSIRETIKEFKNFDVDYEVYSASISEKWVYEYLNRKGEKSAANKNLYVHIYYNGYRAEEEKAKFAKELTLAENAYRNNSGSDKQKNLCEQYFIISKDGNSDKLAYDEKKIAEHMDNFGYFVLLSNHVK